MINYLPFRPSTGIRKRVLYWPFMIPTDSPGSWLGEGDLDTSDVEPLSNGEESAPLSPSTIGGDLVAVSSTFFRPALQRLPQLAIILSSHEGGGLGTASRSRSSRSSSSSSSSCMSCSPHSSLTSSSVRPAQSTCVSCPSSVQSTLLNLPVLARLSVSKTRERISNTFCRCGATECQRPGT